MDCPACHHPNADGARFCAKCGAPLPAVAASDADPLIGTVVGGRFRIASILGEGGMGRVYSADQQMGTSVRKVAVKTLLAQFAKDPQTVARFMREVGTVSELEHPNTIRVYDFGQTPTGELYIAMELLTGESLEHLLERGGPLQPERVDRIMAQVCGSLQEAHNKGIVHRDLKPANIQLSERAGEHDYVKVLDFGIAKRAETKDSKAEQKLTQQGTILGTPPYMSPEQFVGKELDARSDIYSLGVMVYEMLTGKLPFEADTPWQWATQHMTAQPHPFEASALGGQVPPKMREAIMRALHKDREKRQQTVRELYEELTLGAQRLSMVGSIPSSVMAATAPAGDTNVMSAPGAGATGGGKTQLGEPAFVTGPVAAPAPAGKTLLEPLPPTAPSPHLAQGMAMGGAQMPSAPHGSGPQKSNTGIIVGAVAVVAVLALVIGVVVTRKPAGDDTPPITMSSAAPVALASEAPPPDTAPIPVPDAGKSDPPVKPTTNPTASPATSGTASADAKADAACEAAYGLALGGNVSIAIQNYRSCKGPKAPKALAAIDGATVRKVKSDGCKAKALADQAASIGAGSGRAALPASCKK
jgi:hypothetical protein